MTLRQIALMIEGYNDSITQQVRMVEMADKLRWNNTVAILVQIGNAVTTGKGKRTDPMKCCPWRDEASQKQERVTSGIPLTKANVVQVLSAAFGIKT